jgi:hypothetical protein
MTIDIQQFTTKPESGVATPPVSFSHTPGFMQLAGHMARILINFLLNFRGLTTKQAIPQLF